MAKRKKLHQLLAKKPSRKVPIIPKQILNRPWLPPPYSHNGRLENKKHYNYKIYLGETLHDQNPNWNLEYEFHDLPSFYHARYNRFLNYNPDIFIEYHDDISKQSYFADIEINGGIHYKNRDQILKVKERKDLIYPLLKQMKARDKPDYKTVGSYIIVDVDEFEYDPIQSIVNTVKAEIIHGGLYPHNIDEILYNLLKVAK